MQHHALHVTVGTPFQSMCAHVQSLQQGGNCLHTGRKESREAKLDAGCALPVHFAVSSNAALSGALPATISPHQILPRR